MSSPTYSEKSQTEWYYSIRGDASRRGLVNEVTLSRMATEGNLKPDDLVWNKATGDQWSPASSIPGLFPQRTLEPVSEQPQVPLDNIPISKRHRSSLPILLVVGVLLLYPTSWFCQKLYTGEQALPTPIANLLGVEVVQEGLPDIKLYGDLIELHIVNGRLDKAKDLIIEMSRYDVHRQVANAYRDKVKEAQRNIDRQAELTRSIPIASKYLDDERLDLATPLIAQLAQSGRHKEAAQDLAQRAAALKAEQARRKGLEDQLRQGRQTPASLRALVDVYEKKRQQADLFNLTENILQNRKTLPARACLGVAQLYSMLNKPTHLKVALENFVSRVEATTAPSELMEARDLYYTLGEPLKAAALLEPYLETHPDAFDLWLELAAIRAEAGDSKAALAHLKNALKEEAPRLKDKAVADKRFDSIRDTWAFGRLVKKD